MSSINATLCDACPFGQTTTAQGSICISNEKHSMPDNVMMIFFIFVTSFALLLLATILLLLKLKKMN
jgi:hypothetical protein